MIRGPQPVGVAPGGHHFDLPPPDRVLIGKLPALGCVLLLEFTNLFVLPLLELGLGRVFRRSSSCLRARMIGSLCMDRPKSVCCFFNI